MKKFVIEEGIIGFIIVEAPNFIVDNLDYYDVAFNDWVGSQKRFEAVTDFGEIGLCFGYDDMIEYLNDIVLVDSQEKAKVIKNDFYELNDEEKKLPMVVI